MQVKAICDLFCYMINTIFSNFWCQTNRHNPLMDALNLFSQESKKGLGTHYHLSSTNLLLVSANNLKVKYSLQLYSLTISEMVLWPICLHWGSVIVPLLFPSLFLVLTDRGNWIFLKWLAWWLICWMHQNHYENSLFSSYFFFFLRNNNVKLGMIIHFEFEKFSRDYPMKNGLGLILLSCGNGNEAKIYLLSNFGNGTRIIIIISLHLVLFLKLKKYYFIFTL